MQLGMSAAVFMLNVKNLLLKELLDASVMFSFRKKKHGLLWKGKPRFVLC